MTLADGIADAAAVANGAAFEHIELSRLRPAPDNVRRSVGDVGGLAESISAVGILEPLIVVPIDGTEDFLIVAGARRRAAAEKAGLEVVPCIVRTDLTDGARIEAMLVENLQRQDLTPLEEAEGYQRLVDLGLSQRNIAEKVGCKQPHVSKRLALLELPPSARNALDAGSINVAGATALLKAKDRPELIDKAVKAFPKPSKKEGVRALEADEVERVVDRTVTEALNKVKAQELKLEINAKGWVAITPPKSYSEKRQWRMLCRDKWSIDYPGPQRVAVLASAHRKEPCHGAYVETDYSGTPSLVEVCTDPARHAAKGDSALKVPKKEKGAARGGDAEEAARRKQRKALGVRRIQFLQGELNGKVSKTDALSLIAITLVGEVWEDKRKTACEILGIDNRRGSLEEFAAKGEVELLRAAVAVALGVGDVRARAPFAAWDAPVDRLYDFLEKAGYELDDFEREQLGKGKAATRLAELEDRWGTLDGALENEELDDQARAELVAEQEQVTAEIAELESAAV